MANDRAAETTIEVVLEQDDQARRGILTTDHAASSYGLPVLVIDGTPLGSRDATGTVYAEVVMTKPGDPGTEHDSGPRPALAWQLAIITAARRAGYMVRS